MNFKHLVSRKTINCISRFSGRSLSSYPCLYANFSVISSAISPSFLPPNKEASSYLQRSIYPSSCRSFKRYIHAGQETVVNDNFAIGTDINSDDSEDDGTMNEFLSRFVWIMRGKLLEVYSGYDKDTINGMLLIIVGKVVSEMEKGGLERMLGAVTATPSQDFSEDLWKTVWEVSNVVLDDMQKARKKEKLKGFLQSEEVKAMYRFAGEVGIRGDMLRELRYKWAREKMDESEFYQELEHLRQEDAQSQEAESQRVSRTAGIMDYEETVGTDSMVMEEKPKVFTLPKRHGKIKYQIYGLDLSHPKWADVADKIHESGEVIWPQEPKQISGKSKVVMERILSLQEDDDPSPLLSEWIELVQPSRVDWITLLDGFQEKNTHLYLKVAELVLNEESFQANIRDYTKLIDTHAKANRLEDAERILQKMTKNGIFPDILTFTIMVHMYSKAGNLDRAKEAFENLRSRGFQPDTGIYNSMIIAYVNAGQPKMGESLMREMEARDIKPTMEIYMALLRSFAQHGDVNGAQRIATTMQFAGFQPSLESCTLLVEAFGQAGDPEQARHHFDYMIKVGHKPDDRSTASLLAAYGKKNLLDKALNLLLQLEKDGFEPGVATYTVLVDWMGRLQLIDEAEQLLGKISQLGEAPPFQVHVSLCEMYARAGFEKKALQALGVLEAKKDQLGGEEFERVISALLAGGFVQDAHKLRGLMEAEGFVPSEPLKVSLMASQAFIRKRATMK